MRVTQSMLSNNMLRNLSNSYNRIGKLQDQIATQKKITRPSDDPVVAMKGIMYRRNLQEVQQYDRNFGEAYSWVDNSDDALDTAGQAMQRIRELVNQASNDTYDATQRESIKQEVEQLKNHLIEVANTKFGDKYMFNGTDTLNKPVNADGSVVSDNFNPVQLELSKGVYIQVNVDPTNVFSGDLFKDLDNLIGSLDDATKSGADFTGYLGTMDTHINNVLGARADLGARYNRIELMESRVASQEVISTKVLSENEDIDIEKAIIEFTTQESVHRAALSIGAQIIQPSLMDFLR